MKYRPGSETTFSHSRKTYREMKHKPLPDHVKKYITPGAKVEFWCRRAVFEMVEEFSQGIFGLYLMFSTALAAAYYDLLPADWPFGVALVVLSLWFSRVAFLEWKRWQYEVHVVTRNEDMPGGQYIRVRGWLNETPIFEPIMLASPTVIAPERFFYRWWGRITGEQMIGVGLHGQNRIVLNSRKLHPDLVAAINRVQTTRSLDAGGEVSDRMRDATEIAKLVSAGYLEEEEGSAMILAITREVAYYGQ